LAPRTVLGLPYMISQNPKEIPSLFLIQNQDPLEFLKLHGWKCWDFLGFFRDFGDFLGLFPSVNSLVQTVYISYEFRKIRKFEQETIKYLKLLKITSKQINL
jgi:hypothetical protein